MRAWFDLWARCIANYSGTWIAFAAAAACVLAWLIAGFFVGFADVLFQMWINTGTTILTFLMVFVIQNTQIRDTAAMQLKLDELIRVTAARNELIALEEQAEAEIARQKENFPSV